MNESGNESVVGEEGLSDEELEARVQSGEYDKEVIGEHPKEELSADELKVLDRKITKGVQSGKHDKKITGSEAEIKMTAEESEDLDARTEGSVQSGEHDDIIGTAGRQEGKVEEEIEDEVEESQPDVDSEGNPIVAETKEEIKNGNVKGIASGGEDAEEGDLAA